MKKIIFFDLDGTLINPFPRLYTLHKNLARQFGIQSKAEEEFMSLKKKSIGDESWISQQLPALQVEAYLKKKAELLESPEYLFHDILFPFSLDTVKKIKEKAKIVLVTRRKEVENLHEQLRKLGLHEHFDEILAIGKKRGSKANLIQMHLPAIPPDSCIIGDTEDDISAGKELGIKTIAVESGLRSKEFLQRRNPDYLIKDISKIFELKLF